MLITDLVYIDSTGYHFADYPAFLSWVTTTYLGIYPDSDLDPDTEDGQFLAILAQAFFDTASLGASTYNSFSPATGQGVGLARNVKINGLSKQKPTYSTVALTIVGTAGTVITNGIAQDSLGQNWVLPTTVTIPGGGSITVTGTAQVIGAVTAGAATITIIFTPTLGWQTVNNVSAATPGAPVESDAQLRLRQQVSVANPSLTVMEGTYGAVANVPGVTKVQTYENDTGSTDGDGIPAHKIAVIVAGGDSVAVAEAIQKHKTPGVGTYASDNVVTKIVTDKNGMPVTINFCQPPVIATIGFELTLATFVGWTTDYEAIIAQQISAAIAALPIGATVYLTQYYLAAYLAPPAGLTYNITSIRIKKNGGGFGTSNIALVYNEEAVTSAVPGVNVVFV